MTHENPAADTDTVKVYEIYASLQGEGTRAGRPCTLVRLAACDLRCVWCDTAYAFTGGTRRTIEEVVSAVAALGVRLVELTGGEPLLQPGTVPLLARLCDEGYEVLLETGGHRDISAVDSRVVRIVDLKAPGSGEEAKNRWENLHHLTGRDELKIVIASRADYEWARGVLARHDLPGRLPILFSPVHGAIEPERLAGWILEDRLDVRLQLQLHKLLWGATTPGV